MSGFKETCTLGKYMGVPLRRKTPKKKDYWYIIEHVILNLQLGNLNVYRCNSNLEEMIV